MNRSLGTFYVMYAFKSLDFQRGIFILYLLSLSLTQTKIGILQTTLFLGSLALEVPSGLIADRYGRKMAIIISFISLSIYGIGFLIFSSFTPFAILFFVYGFGMAMSSGSDIALLYDNLKSYKGEGEFALILSHTRAISAFSLGFAMLTGSIMAQYISYDIVYIIFTASHLIGAFVTTALKEESYANTLNNKNKNTLKDFKDFFSSHDGLLLTPLFLGQGLLISSIAPLYIFAQDIFNKQGLSLTTTGIMYALIEFLAVLMFLKSDKILTRFSFLQIALYTTIITSLLLFVFAFIKSAILLSILFVAIITIPIYYEVSYENYINSFISSNIRASSISVGNFIISFFIGISFYLFALFSEKLGHFNTFVLFSIVCFVSFFCTLFTINRLK